MQNVKITKGGKIVLAKKKKTMLVIRLISKGSMVEEYSKIISKAANMKTVKDIRTTSFRRLDFARS